MLFDAFVLQKALYEVSYELNNRPDWVRIPLRGILTPDRLSCSHFPQNGNVTSCLPKATSTSSKKARTPSLPTFWARISTDGGAQFRGLGAECKQRLGQSAISTAGMRTQPRCSARAARACGRDSLLARGTAQNISSGFSRRHRHFTVAKADPFGIFHDTPPKTASIFWKLDYEWGDGEWMARRGSANSLRRADVDL